MGKSLLATLLFLAFSLVAIAPSGARAATLYGGDYARIGVPDLEQAAAFFRNVLDCHLIGPEPIATTVAPDGAPASRLVSCDAGSVIELFDNRGMPSSSVPHPATQPLQFVADDVFHAGQWLRRDGASVAGSPHRVTSGPLAGRTVLDFAAPWGLRLQLIGRDESHAPAEGSLATVDAPPGGG
jgi:catechol 2,3-dioxygenase-like lactoylglutathione lyase family enzyme